MWTKTPVRVPSASKEKSSDTGSAPNAERDPWSSDVATPLSEPSLAVPEAINPPASFTVAPILTDSPMNTAEHLQAALPKVSGETWQKIQQVAEGRSQSVTSVVEAMLTFCAENEFYG